MSDLGNKEIFAKNLQYYMTINKKDRNDIARDLNLPYTTVTSWYNGEFYPRIDKIELLANYFCIKKSDLVENKENIEKDKQAFPLLGTVKAGYNYLVNENVIGYVALDRKIFQPENCYALKIKGDSMQPILYENDIVIVNRQNDVESGEIAIVLIDDEEATIKKIIKTPEGIELHAFNPYYPIKKFSFEDMERIPVKIIGKVIEGRIYGIFE